MQDRSHGWVALVAVVAVSIVFGMILGGKINAPPVVFAAPSGSGLVLAPASTAPATSVDFADIAERAIPAVVAVTSAQLEDGEAADLRGHPFFNDPFFRRFFGDPENEGEGEGEGGPPNPHRTPRIGEGSGFIISTDGYILTNNHVVEESDAVEVSLDSGKTFPAKVVGADPSIDLALLKIEAGDQPLPTLPLGDSDGLRVGEWVIAIGNPLEFDQTVTVGVVSGKNRRVPLRSTDTAVVSFIQTDAAINFGNSGGPLLDARGNVVGINTAINRQFLAEGIGFALPINQARNVVHQLRENGYVKRGFLGITMNREPLDEAAQEFYRLPDSNGVIISNVQEGGPGAQAGLRSGDVIRKVDGQVVADNYDLVSKIASHQPGEQVALQVYRRAANGRPATTLELSVQLADRDEGISTAQQRGERRRPEPERETYASEGLGVTVEALTPALRGELNLTNEQQGVVVTDVEFGSEAAARGIQPGMVVVAVNDAPVESVSDWRQALSGLDAGSSAKVDVLANQQTTFFFLRIPRD